LILPTKERVLSRSGAEAEERAANGSSRARWLALWRSAAAGRALRRCAVRALNGAELFVPDLDDFAS
jgi:hypothetical protein